MVHGILCDLYDRNPCYYGTNPPGLVLECHFLERTDNMARRRTLPRKPFMGPTVVRPDSPDLSDAHDLAVHMLQNGYRTAAKAASDNYNAATPDNKAEWQKVRVWIGMLGDR